MIAALILTIFGLSSLTAERAAYLLGPDSEVVEAPPYTHLVHPGLPFVLTFFQDPALPSTGRFHSWSLRSSFFVPSRVIGNRGLKGTWLCFPIDLPMSLRSPYMLACSNHAITLDYVFFQHAFLFRVSTFGCIQKVSMWFPLEEERRAYIGHPDTDHGLLTQYFVVLGQVAISWRPVSCATLGRLSICIRE
jgi:hypothetical protein